MTAWTLSPKYTILEIKQICLHSEQGQRVTEEAYTSEQRSDASLLSVVEKFRSTSQKHWG